MTDVSDRPRTTRPAVIAMALLVVAAGAASFTLVWNYDVHWHLAAGQWMLEHGELLDTDPFSVPDLDHWLNIHWLFQWIVAGLHAMGGFAALTVMKSALAAAVMLTFVLALRKQVSTPWLVLSGGLALQVMLSRIRVRPEAFTLVFLMVTIALLESVRRGGPARRLWWLTPVMLVWVNMHGLFVLGLAVIWTSVFGAVVDRHVFKRPATALAGQRALGPILAATAACLVSPWPIETFLHPFLLWTRVSGQEVFYTYTVGELQPTWEALSSQTVPIVLVAAALAAMVVGFRRLPVTHGLWLVLFVGLGLQARRNVGLIGPPCGYLLALHGQALLNRLRIPNWLYGAATAAVALLAAAAVLGYATEWIPRATGSAARFGAGRQRENYPLATAKFLADLPADGNVLCMNFGDASTFINGSWPRRRVWMDGRLEVHSKERFQQYHDLISSELATVKAARRTTRLPDGVRYYFVNAEGRSQLSVFAQADRFRLIYLDAAGACFARTDDYHGGPPLPARSNLDDWDRPLLPDGHIEGFPPQQRRWYRQNARPLVYRTGQMLMWLGRRPEMTFPPPANALQRRCSLLAVRYLTAATFENLHRPEVLTGMLAQAHQQRAKCDRITASAVLPVDINSARALYLYNQLDLGGLDPFELQQFGTQRVAGMREAHQFDAAETAVRKLRDFFPGKRRVRPPQWYHKMTDWAASAVSGAKATLAEMDLTGVSQAVRARIIAGPRIGLIDQAIAELAAAPAGSLTSGTAHGDLLLRKGLVFQARDAYRGTGAALPLRSALCDWTEGKLFDAEKALAAITTRPDAAASARCYHALLLEQLGRYPEARKILARTHATDPAVKELLTRISLRLRPT